MTKVKNEYQRSEGCEGVVPIVLGVEEERKRGREEKREIGKMLGDLFCLGASEVGREGAKILGPVFGRKA
jgi:hypothetical protein